MAKKKLIRADLKIRVLEAKNKLPSHGLTALFFHYFKNDFTNSTKNKSKLSNVLQTRITDENMTVKLEELVDILTPK